METKPYKYSPEILEKKIEEYFNWCDNNPMYKYEVVKTGQDAGKELKIKVQRPYTKQGIVVFLDINSQTWQNWSNENDSNNKEILAIVTQANQKITQNQIEGAGNGLFNPLIISRLNGLTEKVEQTTTTIDTTNKSEDEIRAAISAIEQARKSKS
jgi:hypothetical protein